MKTPDELTELFRARGLKVTPQRQAIFRVLARGEDRTRARSRSTTTVSAVHAHDLAAHRVPNAQRPGGDGRGDPLDLGTGSARFDPNVDAHHHLVCDRCGRVRRRLRRRRLGAGRRPTASRLHDQLHRSGFPGHVLPHDCKRKERQCLISTARKTHEQPEGGVRRREPGQPSLPVLRPEGRHRGLPRRRRAVPLGRRGRDRARLRPLRLPRRGRRSRHRRAGRRHRGQPEVRHRGRDLRVHRDVPRASRRPPATRASTRSPSGSRRWPGPRSRHAGRFTQGLESDRADDDVGPDPSSTCARSSVRQGEPVKLTLDDIADLRAYERERDEFRAASSTSRSAGASAIGPFVTLVFENRDTIRFQIQEMARAEKIITDDAIQTELDIYNPLIPDPGWLAATLFIELRRRTTSSSGCRSWSGSSDRSSCASAPAADEEVVAARPDEDARAPAHAGGDHRLGALRALRAVACTDRRGSNPSLSPSRSRTRTTHTRQNCPIPASSRCSATFSAEWLCETVDCSCQHVGTQ